MLDENTMPVEDVNETVDETTSDEENESDME